MSPDIVGVQFERPLKKLGGFGLMVSPEVLEPSEPGEFPGFLVELHGCLKGLDLLR